VEDVTPKPSSTTCPSAAPSPATGTPSGGAGRTTIRSAPHSVSGGHCFLTEDGTGIVVVHMRGLTGAGGAPCSQAFNPSTPVEL
jgi:hypothetical protein